MSRQSIGAFYFGDLGLDTRAWVGITRFPEMKMTSLFLILDVEGRMVRGTGDCEIALNNENTRRLVTLIREASSISPEEDHLWQRIGEAEFHWSDKLRTGEMEDFGLVIVESNGSAARMTIQFTIRPVEPYVATFSLADVNKLSAFLTRALSKQ